MAEAQDMKRRVARTIKWNVIDRVASQVLYAVTGIVLARVLTPDDFGLVGAVLVFQAFASLFVDSGFSAALIQRKSPTQLDYSSVLWFNMAMAVTIYALLWFCAPIIADWFQGDERLIPLSRVMFLSFIINASAIVQTNRLMKRMDVKMVALSNSLGLALGGLVGIALALLGYGAWALVWQTIVIAVVKSAVLWITGRWLPQLRLSWRVLRGFAGVGFGVMGSSFLNTLFQNIYSFIIGNRVGMVSLGYYTQADKWSKMPVASLSQVLTSSFLPALSQYQDHPQRFAAATSRISRFTAWLLFPVVGLLIVAARPLFHVLLGSQWDAAVGLFCILLVRGVFTVMTGLYSNYILALGRSKLLVASEVLRDVVALVAVVCTLPALAACSDADPVGGLSVFLWGQVLAAVIAWAYTLRIAARLSHRTIVSFLTDLLPYIAAAIVALLPAAALTVVVDSDWGLLVGQSLIVAAVYFVISRVARFPEMADALEFVSRRK